MVNLDVGRLKWAPHEIDLMADDAGIVQTVVVTAIGRGIVIGCIMNFIPHGLKQSDIIHFELRNKPADSGYQKNFLFG